MLATHPIIKYFSSPEEMDVQRELMQRVHGQRLRFVGMDFPLMDTENVADNLSLWCQHPDVDLERVAKLKKEPIISSLLKLSPKNITPDEILLAQLLRGCILKKSIIIIYDFQLFCNDTEKTHAIMSLMLAHNPHIFIFASIKDKELLQKLLCRDGK